MNDLISVKQVSKKYGKNHALTDVSFTIPKGRIVGLLGPNGSGKTTIMKILAGLLQRDSGEIVICGQPISSESKALISYMPDLIPFYKWMRISDAIRCYQDFFPDFNKQKAIELCEFLKLNQDEPITKMSKGTKERVNIALAFARDTKIYILDEPISGIDPVVKEKILKSVLQEFNPECSILLSTQLVRDTEEILDDVLFIKKGQIVLADSTDTIRMTYRKSVEKHYLEVFGDD